MADRINYKDKLASLVQGDVKYEKMADAIFEELSGIAHIGSATIQEREAFFTQVIAMQMQKGNDIISQIGDSVDIIDFQIFSENTRQNLADFGEGMGETFRLQGEAVSEAATALSKGWNHLIGNRITQDDAYEITYRVLERRQMMDAKGLQTIESTELWGALANLWHSIQDSIGEPLGAFWDSVKARVLSWTSDKPYEVLYEEMQLARSERRVERAHNSELEQARIRSGSLYDFVQGMEFGEPDKDGNRKLVGSTLATLITGIDSKNNIVSEPLTEIPDIAAGFQREIDQKAPGFWKQAGQLISEHPYSSVTAGLISVELAAKSPALARLAYNHTMVGRGVGKTLGFLTTNSVTSQAAKYLGTKVVSVVKASSPFVKNAAGSAIGAARGVSLGAMLRGGGKLMARASGALGAALIVYDVAAFASEEAARLQAIEDTLGDDGVDNVMDMLEQAIAANPEMVHFLPEGNLKGYALHLANDVHIKAAIEALENGSPLSEEQLSKVPLAKRGLENGMSADRMIAALKSQLSAQPQAIHDALQGELGAWILSVYEAEGVAGPAVMQAITDEIRVHLEGASTAASKAQLTQPQQDLLGALPPAALEKLLGARVTGHKLAFTESSIAGNRSQIPPHVRSEDSPSLGFSLSS